MALTRPAGCFLQFMGACFLFLGLYYFGAGAGAFYTESATVGYYLIGSFWSVVALILILWGRPPVTPGK